MQNEYMVEWVSVPSHIEPGALRCPWCGQFVTLVWVHGHGQCPECGTNVDECCRGERCEQKFEVGSEKSV